MRDVASSIDLVAGVRDERDEPQASEVTSDPVAEALGAATLRRRVAVTAVVVSVAPTWRPIGYVDVVVDDGTGQLCCRFFGRPAIRGLERGSRVRVTGRVTLHLGKVCVLSLIHI